MDESRTTSLLAVAAQVWGLAEHGRDDNNSCLDTMGTTVADSVAPLTLTMDTIKLQAHHVITKHGPWDGHLY